MNIYDLQALVVNVYTIGGIVGLFSLAILRYVLRDDPYRFEIVLMKPGVNQHFELKGKSLNFDFRYDDKGEAKTFNVKSDRLYRIKLGWRARLKYWFRGRQALFWVQFREGSDEPVNLPKYEVSARILHEVNESRALDKAMDSEFKVPWDLKKFVIVFGVIVIGAIVYLYMTGQVTP